MFAIILQLAASALSIWDNAERSKYADKLARLEKEYYAEKNKAPNERSDAVLDNLRFELCITASALGTAIGSANAKNKS